MKTMKNIDWLDEELKACIEEGVLDGREKYVTGDRALTFQDFEDVTGQDEEGRNVLFELDDGCTIEVEQIEKGDPGERSTWDYPGDPGRFPVYTAEGVIRGRLYHVDDHWQIIDPEENIPYEFHYEAEYEDEYREPEVEDDDFPWRSTWLR